MPKKVKVLHGKSALEVSQLHVQLEEEITLAVGRFAQRFLQAIDQLIKANPLKLRLIQEAELRANYPYDHTEPVHVMPTRWVTNSVYATLVYADTLVLTVSPGPEGHSIRVQFKEKAQHGPQGWAFYCGGRHWSATVYSFDTMLTKAAHYHQFMLDLLAAKQEHPQPLRK